MARLSRGTDEPLTPGMLSMLDDLNDATHHASLVERTKLALEILGHYKVLVCNPNRTFGQLLLGQVKIIANQVTGHCFIGVSRSSSEGRLLIDQVTTRLIVITTVALVDGPVNSWLTELKQRSAPTFTFVIMDAAHRSTVKTVMDAGAQAAMLQTNIGKGVLLEALEALEQGHRYLDPECRLALENHERVSDELSARELEILELVAEGMSNKEIAKRLVIAEVTARDHVQKILRKLRVDNRTAAVLAGVRQGYLHWLNA